MADISITLTDDEWKLVIVQLAARREELKQWAAEYNPHGICKEMADLLGDIEKVIWENLK